MKRKLVCFCVSIMLMCTFAVAATPNQEPIDLGVQVLWLDAYSKVEPFSCGYARVTKDGEQWFVDAKGERLVLDQPYVYLGRGFHNGLAAVMLTPAHGDGGQMGWIGTDGRLKIPLIYDSRYYSEFSRNTIAAVNYNDKSLVTLNTAGSIIAVAKANMRLTEEVKSSSNGLLPVVICDNYKELSTGFVDRFWNVVIPANYKYVYTGFSGGGACASMHKSEFNIDPQNFYAVNVKGEEVGAPINSSNANAFRTFTEGFGDGLLAICNDDGVWGAMNTHGELAIPYQYDTLFHFNDGYAFSLNDGILQMINTDGNVVVPRVEADIDETQNNVEYYVSEGLAAICQDGKWGYIDSRGNEIIPFQFQQATAFSEGLSWVCRADGTWGILKSPLAIKSSWAESYIKTAYICEIVTERTDSEFSKPMTRLQCAEQVVNLVELVTGLPIVEAEGSRFVDTQDWMALKAAQAGIAYGIGDGTTFCPESSITREQLSAMLCRAIRYVEQETGEAVLPAAGDLSAYTDTDQISAWAVEDMALLNAAGILNGTSATTLSPKDTTTVEQAIIMVLRAYQKF